MPPSYPAGSYPAQVMADGAVAYWRLGETAGTTASDSIGTAHGTISGGVTLGQAGALADGDKAMLFDGNTSAMVTSAVTLPAAFTLECWLRPEATPVGEAIVLSTRQLAVGADELILQLSVTRRLYVYFQIVGGTSVTGILPLNAWSHFACVHSGTGVRLYLNGVPATSEELLAHNLSPAPLRVDHDVHSAGPNFSGLYDEVAIYPIALTAPQIAAHYAAKDWKAFSPGFSKLEYRWCRYVPPRVRR